jgi:hypothetical protein
VPDANNRFRGITVPELPWHNKRSREEEIAELRAELDNGMQTIHVRMAIVERLIHLEAS